MGKLLLENGDALKNDALKSLFLWGLKKICENNLCLIHLLKHILDKKTKIIFKKTQS